METFPHETLTIIAQVAEKLSGYLGRDIEHVKLTGEERIQSYLGQGLPDFFANFLAYLETEAAKQVENRTNDAVEQVTGRPGQTFDAFAKENKAAWQ